MKLVLEGKKYFGEWYYVSPEVAEEGQEYGEAADVWAVGMLLREMTTAEPKPK